MPNVTLDRDYLHNGTVYPAGEQDVPQAVADALIATQQRVQADAQPDEHQERDQPAAPPAKKGGK